MFSRARLSGSPSPCYPQAARQAMAARRSGLVAGTLIPLIFLATACGGDASDGGDGAPELHASIAQDRRVIALRGSCTTSLNLRSPVTLRGAPPAGDPIPTLRGTAERDTTVSIEAGQTDKFGIEALRLEHPGGAAEPANETARARLNITDQLDTDPGLCCIGVDGGKVRVLSCAISSFNGTCFGGTGNLTSALLTNCTLSDANFGVVVASGARVCVERSLFTHLREALPLPPAQPPQDPALLTAGARGQAGVVAMGNSTLAEMEANRIEGGASGGHGAGVLGLSVTAGARAVCLGNEAVGCGRAALSVSGAPARPCARGRASKRGGPFRTAALLSSPPSRALPSRCGCAGAGSFASVSDGLARGPGEYGALVSDRGRASV